MSEDLLTEKIEAPVIELEPPKFSGLLQSIFPDGTIEYDGQIGAPEDFPLTESEIAEVLSPGVAPVPPQPVPNYVAFWDALLASSIYASIREQTMESLPMNTLATEFIALLGDAKAGRENQAAIQASMAAILQVGTFTEAQLDELGAALEIGHIQDLYSLIPVDL